jgi:hypothetical protein
MITRVGGGSEEDEEGDKHNHEPLPSVYKVHAAYRTVKLFLYMHTISTNTTF